MDQLSIELHACDRLRNRFRAWRIEIGRDLFGMLNARITYGRIGCTGRTRRWDFSTEDAAEAFLSAGLRRRASATRRIGTPYRLVSATPAAQPLLDRVGFGASAIAGPARGHRPESPLVSPAKKSPLAAGATSGTHLFTTM